MQSTRSALAAGSRSLEGASPGTHTFTVGAERALGGGVYLIRVANGSEVRELKTTVMR